MGRPPACCVNGNLKRGLWTPEEDAKILAHVSKHGTGNWTSVPKKAGLRRCGKSCRLRWNNYLRPDLNHDTFKPEEEEMIVRLHAAIGSRWSIIAQQLPGRTDNDVKNHWNTKLRKKLSEMGIDPVTHKPFSQILTDYGNINGGLQSRPSTTTRIGSLSRDLKSATTLLVHNPNSFPQSTTHFMEEGEPEMLPISECFIINNGNYASNDVKEEQQQSVDLLDQLQAIKLATEAAGAETGDKSSFPPSSSSSSSSSTCSTEMMMMKKKSSPPFSWRDFLLEDDDEGEFQENGDDGHGGWELSTKQRQTQQQQNCYAGNGGLGPSSFVEAILDEDRRRDMFLDLSSLLQDPNY